VKGRIGRAYIPDPAARTVYLEGFAIYFILFILGFGLLRRYFGLMSLQWEWLALFIIPIVMLWLGWNGVSIEDQRTALGWHKGKGVLREAGAGLAGYLAGIVVMIAGVLGSHRSIHSFRCFRVADGMCSGYTCWSACLRR
jgi:hypothetical protein